MVVEKSKVKLKTDPYSDFSMLEEVNRTSCTHQLYYSYRATFIFPLRDYTMNVRKIYLNLRGSQGILFPHPSEPTSKCL